MKEQLVWHARWIGRVRLPDMLHEAVLHGEQKTDTYLEARIVWILEQSGRWQGSMYWPYKFYSTTWRLTRCWEL